MKTDPKKSGCPIIVIHKGYSWYLPYTLQQARFWNPQSEIILVTDQHRLFLKLFALCIPLKPHMKEGNAFREIYTHLSPNEAEFELFCFQRWFVLHSVMCSLELDHCFYLDSDVLLYSEITQLRTRYPAKLTVNFEQGPHSTYINDLSSLRGFCDYINRAFTDHTAEMATDYAEWQRQGLWGGISDMHVLKGYVRDSSLQIADTADIVEGACFDQTVHVSSGYEMNNGIKAIDWRGGIPHVRYTPTGEIVRFHSLHMQGNSKWRILDFHSGQTWRTFLTRLYNRIFK